MGCTSEGARRAADQDYRRGIAAPDSQNLAAPLAEDATPATLNRGLQVNDRSGAVLSPRFEAAGQTATLVLVNWGRDKNGTLVALSKRTTAEFTAGAQVDAEGFFFADEQILPCTAPQFEVRVEALAGTIENLKVWDL